MISCRCECGKFCAAGESACSSCAKAGHSSIEPALIDTVLPAHVGPTVSKKCVRLPSHYAAGFTVCIGFMWGLFGSSLPLHRCACGGFCVNGEAMCLGCAKASYSMSNPDTAEAQIDTEDCPAAVESFSRC